MTRTPSEFVQWCRDHPTDNNEPGKTWDQKCGSLVFRAGGFSTSATSAYLMALATEGHGHHLYSAEEIPFDEIPVGWFVYFDKAGPKNGHIGMVDGRDSFLSANWRSNPMTPRHLALGSMGIAYYASISDRYMGASPYFIDSTLSGVSTSAALNTAALPAEKEDPDMAKAVRVTEEGVPEFGWTYLYGGGVAGGWVEIPPGQDGYYNVWSASEFGGKAPEQISRVEYLVLKSAYQTIPGAGPSDVTATASAVAAELAKRLAQ